jgi:hypothetical protein
LYSNDKEGKHFDTKPVRLPFQELSDIGNHDKNLKLAGMFYWWQSLVTFSYSRVVVKSYFIINYSGALVENV